MNGLHDLTSDELALFGGIVAISQSNPPGGALREKIVKDLATLLRSDASVSFAWDRRGSRFIDPRYCNVSASNIRRFEEHFQFKDQWWSRIKQMARPTLLEHIVPTAEFESSAVFNEVLAPDSLYRVLALNVSEGTNQLGRITVLRERVRPAFGEREVALLSVLEPFLSRGFKDVGIGLPEFTPREREVAHLVARGCADRDIARILGIAFYTVRSHVNNAMEKSGCANRAELAAFVASSLIAS